MKQKILKYPFKAGQFFGLLLGDGSLSNSISFCNSNPRYVFYFLKLSKELFGLKHTDFRFYLQNVDECNKNKIVKKWMKNLDFLGNEKMCITIKKEKNKPWKSVMSMRHSNIKFLKHISSFASKDINIAIKNIRFAKGFVDGFFAAEGHADAHKSSIKAIITQNKGEKAELIERALKTTGLRYHIIKDRETKLQFRIASNESLRLLSSFCEISNDKFNKIIPLLAGKYRLIKKGISHFILANLKNSRKKSISELYQNITQFKNCNIYWYLKNKKSPLLKYNLITNDSKKFSITAEGKNVLKTLEDSSATLFIIVASVGVSLNHCPLKLN